MLTSVAKSGVSANDRFLAWINHESRSQPAPVDTHLARLESLL